MNGGGQLPPSLKMKRVDAQAQTIESQKKLIAALETALEKLKIKYGISEILLQHYKRIVSEYSDMIDCYQQQAAKSNFKGE